MSVGRAASRSDQASPLCVVQADDRVERHRLVQAERLHAVEAARTIVQGWSLRRR